MKHAWRRGGHFRRLTAAGSFQFKAAIIPPEKHAILSTF